MPFLDRLCCRCHKQNQVAKCIATSTQITPGETFCKYKVRITGRVFSAIISDDCFSAFFRMETTTHCVICLDFKLYQLHHFPVQQTCRCTTRVCKHCALLMKTTQCPTCRKESLLPNQMDNEYFTAVCRKERSGRCEGCSQIFSTRVLSRHQKDCSAYLCKTYTDMLAENQQLMDRYRKSVECEKTLREQLNRDFQLIDYLRAVSGGGGLSWPDEQQYQEEPPLPPLEFDDPDPVVPGFGPEMS